MKNLFNRKLLLSTVLFLFTLSYASAEWYILPSDLKVKTENGNNYIYADEKKSSSVWDLSAILNRFFNRAKTSTNTSTTSVQVNGSSTILNSNSNSAADLNSNSMCLYFKTDLKSGDQTNDVRLIQQFLVNQKYLSVIPTGYYGIKTVASVKLFQTRNGIPSTGVLGVKSRLKVAQLTCASNSEAVMTLNSQVNGNTSTTISTTPVQTDNSFRIQAMHSNLCLVTDSLTNRSIVKQGACDSNALAFEKVINNNQISFKVRNTNKCLDVDTYSTTNGTIVILWDCHYDVNQRFVETVNADQSKTYTVVNSQKCLDIDIETTAGAGANLMQWECWGGANQKFKLISASTQISTTNTNTNTNTNTGNQLMCTMEVRICSNGTIMPRDTNCTWREDKCSSSNSNTNSTNGLPTSLTLVPLGDSMTAGNGNSGSFRSYRGKLYDMLKNDAKISNVDFIGPEYSLPLDFPNSDPDHAGWGGAYIGPSGSSNNVYDRLASIFQLNNNPNVIVLAMGWNSAYNETYQVAYQKYLDLGKKLNAEHPNTLLVVATLNPRQYENESVSTSQVDGYGGINKAARELANLSQSDKIVLADLANAGYVNSDYWDGIHLYQSGADKSARLIYDSISNYYKNLNTNIVSSASTQSSAVSTPTQSPLQANTSNIRTVQKIIFDMYKENTNRWYLTLYPNANEDGTYRRDHYGYVTTKLREITSNWDGDWANWKGRMFNLNSTDKVVAQPWAWFGQAYNPGGNNAPNTRVQIRNMTAYTLQNSGEWITRANDEMTPEQMVDGGRGGLYASSAFVTETRTLSKGTALEQYRDEGGNGGGGSIGSVGRGIYENFNLHFWPYAFGPITVNEFTNSINGTLVCFDVRLILHDKNGVDDRNKANMMGLAGMDYYVNGGGVGSNLHNEAFHSSLRLITNDWQVVCATDIETDKLQSNLPPGFTN